MYSTRLLAQHVDVDVAGAHHRGRVLVVDQREQQMLERRVFVVALVGERERLCRACSRLREKDGMSGAFHFFSITHCSGCWCLRAKSMTCVTLVSATS